MIIILCHDGCFIEGMAAMELREIGKDFFVSSQITLEDIAVINKRDIKTIVCNRPDGEDLDQTPFKNIADEAQYYGMAVFYLPIIPHQIMMEDVQKMRSFLQNAHYPLLAYCRSGARSTKLYQLAINKDDF